MATTAKKTTAPRKPQDHQPKQPTRAERLEAEALEEYTGGPFSVEIAGAEVGLLDPDDWPGVAQEALMSGMWIEFGRHCVEPDDFNTFSGAIAAATNRELKPVLAKVLNNARVSRMAVGEGDGSLSS